MSLIRSARADTEVVARNLLEVNDRVKFYKKLGLLIKW